MKAQVKVNPNTETGALYSFSIQDFTNPVCEIYQTQTGRYLVITMTCFYSYSRKVFKERRGAIRHAKNEMLQQIPLMNILLCAETWCGYQ